MSDRARRIEELYGALLERPPEERDTFLKEACGEDTSLRDEVATLVRHHEAAEEEGFLRQRVSESFDESVAAVGERYEVLRKHASGSLGEVLVARDNDFDREVALKRILSSRADDPVCERRFTMEAKITGKLEHPGIVPVYSKGISSDGQPFYAMKFIEGETMRKAIDQLHDRSMSEREWQDSLRALLRRFIDVCQAIDYAHSRGVVHRDIKPANVVLGKFGETMVVDWGIAKLVDSHEESESGPEETLHLRDEPDASATKTGSYLGTPGYMSPEQAKGRTREVGPWSDVFGLGAMLYHILTGKLAYEGRDSKETLLLASKGKFKAPRLQNKRVSFRLQSICEKAMDADPAERYNSAGELAADVENFVEDRPLVARDDTWGEKLGRYCRRKPITAMVLVLVLLLNAPFAVAVIGGSEVKLGAVWLFSTIAVAMGMAIGQVVGILMGVSAGLLGVFRTGGTIRSRFTSCIRSGVEKGVIIGSLAGAYLMICFAVLTTTGKITIDGPEPTDASLSMGLGLGVMWGGFIVMGGPTMLYLWFTHQEERIWSVLGYFFVGAALFLVTGMASEIVVASFPQTIGEEADWQLLTRSVDQKWPVHLEQTLSSIFGGAFFGYMLGGFAGMLSGLWRGKTIDRMIWGSRIGMCVLAALLPLLNLAYFTWELMRKV